MELLKDLIRDLIGIIFPGGLLVFFTVVGSIGIVLFIVPPKDLVEIISKVDSGLIIVILIILSFIAGQNIRIRRLEITEKKATKEYRRKKEEQTKEVTRISREKQEKETEQNNEERESLSSGFDLYKKRINTQIKQYYGGSQTEEDLSKCRVNIRNEFNKSRKCYETWERFPYPLQTKVRMFLEYPKEMIDFYKEYIQQKLFEEEDEKEFFNYCKIHVLKSTTNLKDEVLRQEALIRLNAGLLFVIKTGRIWIGLIFFSHLIFIIKHMFFLWKNSIVESASSEIFNYSILFVIGSIVTSIILFVLYREIIKKDGFRVMRHKEVNMVYTSFFIVKTSKNKETREG